MHRKNPTFFHQRLHQRGGALVVVLLICMIMGAVALFFLHHVVSANLETQRYLFAINTDNAVLSAIQHASLLLREDLASSPADGFQDSWVTVPAGRRVASRRDWMEYAACITNLTGQHWFELPGPAAETVVRYRFKLIDRQAGSNTGPGSQPLVPAAWHNRLWLPTDDITAVDTRSLKELICRFDARGTNSAWYRRALAGLVDCRDDNHELCSPDVPDTEAICFDRIVTAVDCRWNHFEDVLRLGRYYEERPNHNFFLVKHARGFYNTETGRTNIEVTLDNDPYLYVDGWEPYRDLRRKSNLPRWYHAMWNGVRAATGSGLPEPQGLFTYQPVVSNTEYALIFDDEKLERFAEKNGIRQTVTFAGWFSSLNEYMHARIPGAQARGAFVTAAPGAPDCFMLTNLARDARYRMSLSSGTRMPKPHTAQVSFFGVDRFEQAVFQTNGIALLNGGRPVDVKPLHKGNFVEMVIRAPQSGIGPRNPFYLESALLEQPEFIVFRNTADYPVPVKDWRLGYRMGGRLFWSGSFTRAMHYSRRHGRIDENASPIVPGKGYCIITPEASLFDWFIGSRPSGRWGDSSGEHAPVIETGRDTWGPKCMIARAQSVAGHTRTSSSNREYTWETDWELHIPDINWSAPDAVVTNEVVLVDPDGNAKNSLPPVPGIIVRQSSDTLTVRLAGSSDRCSFSPGAYLQFNGIPAAVTSFMLVTPGGGIASVLDIPSAGQSGNGSCRQIVRDASDAPVRELFEWEALQSVIAHDTPRPAAAGNVPGTAFSDIVEKQQTLERLDIACFSDWFVCDSLCLPFKTARIDPGPTLHVSQDTTAVSRYEKGWFIWENSRLSLPEGLPGILFRQVYIAGFGPAAVKSIRSGAFSICDTPGITVTQVLNSHVSLAPTGNGNGMHVFGTPGSIICEWHDITRPEKPVKLTLAGRTATAWRMPLMQSQWSQYTNDPVTISVDIWNPVTRNYDRLVTQQSFDSSDRLFLGEVEQHYVSDGVLRLKIATNDTLAPRQRELWLHSLYLHPYPVRRYVNVNTAFPGTLLRLCNNNKSKAFELLHGSRISNRYTSMREIAAVVHGLQQPSVKDAELSVRSDIFDLYIVAQVLKQTENGEQVMAESRRRMILDRADCRLEPASCVRIGY